MSWGVFYLWGLLPGFVLMFFAMIAAALLDDFDVFIGAAAFPWVFAAIWATVAVILARKNDD